jgi:hypothetical protein
MQYVSQHAVLHTLRERRFWGFCAALATPVAVYHGPNLRLLDALPLEPAAARRSPIDTCAFQSCEQRGRPTPIEEPAS